MAFAVHPGLWDGWRDLAAGAPLLGSPPWLQMRAGKMDGDTTTFVVTRRGDEHPVAGLFATIAVAGVADGAFDVRVLLTGIARTLVPADSAATDPRAALGAAVGDADRWYPHLAVVYPGYECFIAGPERDSPAVAAELIEGIVNWSQREGLRAVAFLYCVPEQAAMEAVLAGAGFARIDLTHSCDLDLPGVGFGDYLAALPKKQRSSVRRERRILAARGVTTSPQKLDDVVDELVGLRLQHAARYGRRVSEEKERGRFAQVVDAFGRDAVFVFVSRTPEHGLLCFSLVLEYGGEWYLLDSGTDYAEPLSDLTYFDVCYDAPIAAAYERGVRTLHAGVGSWDAKRHRGSTCVPRHLWVLALTPELRSALADWLPRFPALPLTTPRRSQLGTVTAALPP